MQLYSARPAQRTWQIVADLVAIGTIVVAVWIANMVRESIAALATFGAQLESAASSFGDTMADAAETLGEVPLVGESISDPFLQAQGAAEQLAAAGGQAQSSVLQIASAVGTALWVLPVLVLLLVWFVPRLRFLLRTRATSKVLAHPAGRDVLALRAVSSVPFAQLVRAVPDPLAAIRSGDPAALDALARLELRGQGVRQPAGFAATPPTAR